MTLREWKKVLVKRGGRKDWISDIFVKTEEGRTENILRSFTGNYYDRMNPSLKKKCLDSEVLRVTRDGPFNSSYSYTVWIDLIVKSVRSYHVVEVKLLSSKVLVSTNEKED